MTSDIYMKQVTYGVGLSRDILILFPIDALPDWSINTRDHTSYVLSNDVSLSNGLLEILLSLLDFDCQMFVRWFIVWMIYFARRIICHYCEDAIFCNTIIIFIKIRTTKWDNKCPGVTKKEGINIKLLLYCRLIKSNWILTYIFYYSYAVDRYMYK